MAQGHFEEEDWSDDFTLRNFGTENQAFLKRRRRLLYAWVTFHSHAQLRNGGPVPPLPPMVLQMLNQASMEVRWRFVNADASGETSFGNHWVPATALRQPNWWRNFELRPDPDPAWLTGLGLRMRRLRVRCSDSSPACYLLANRALVDVDLSTSRVAVAHLEGLARLPNLTKLNVSDCCSFTSVSCLGASRSLVVLDLHRTRVSSEGLVGLERIPTLTKLDLQYCLGVTSVTCLAHSKSLVELNLGVTSVTPYGIKGLERIPTLKRLMLNTCSWMWSVDCLAGSTSLEELNLSYTSVTNLRGVARIPTLVKLELSHHLLPSNVSLANLLKEEALARLKPPPARRHRAE